MNLRPGSQVGPYTVTREIARGGQGAVLEARDPAGRAVALKLLLDDDEEATARFLREAETLSRLSHPNLIRVRDLGQTPGGVAYLALELIRGQTLADWVRGAGPPPLDEVRRVMASAAATLHYCHEQGLVHRDLKPQNLLVEAETGRVVVVDFGLVRRSKLALAWSTQDRASLTQEGAVMGTPAYMPPEQISPEFGGVDRRSDVYGLGATLFFLLTGEAPFKAPGVLQLLAQVASDPAPDPRTSRPELPADLATLCLRSLAKDPNERPSTALEFADVLAAAPSESSKGRLLGALALVGLGILGLGAAGLVIAQGASPSPEPALSQATPTPDPTVQSALPSATPTPAPTPLAVLGTPTPSLTLSPREDVRQETLARAARLMAGEAPKRKEAEALLSGLAEQGDAEAMYRLGMIRLSEEANVAGAEWLKRGAEAGSAPAQLTLGLLHQKGLGVPEDQVAARAYFERSAEAGQAKAMSYLGSQLVLGLGGEANLALGIEWLERAAALGEAAAMLRLGTLAQKGNGVPRDLAQAAAWYQKSADQGHPGGMLKLAELYRDGEGVARDLPRATRLMRRAAEAGFRKAYLHYAKALLFGVGTPKDAAAAAKWYTLAAEGGDLAAADQLGALYLTGRPGLPADPQRGIPWLERAARGGRSSAMFHLGQALIAGVGVESNPRAGAAWTREAAEREHPAAMNLYSKLLAQGNGVPKDLSEALKWLERSANTGYVPAMSRWGRTLRNAKKHDQAFVWLRRAADKGDQEAMLYLATCYSRGEGILRNLDMAKKWLRKTVEAGPDTKLGRRAARDAELIGGGGEPTQRDQALEDQERAPPKGP